MASWSSPRRSASYRDSSPISPLAPLSPSTLPQWLRSKKPRSGVLASARLKTFCIVLACVVLGWFATSTMTPNTEQTLDLSEQAYDTASGGPLTDPSGFGLSPEEKANKDGILEDGEDDDEEADRATNADRKPSVSGALSELHQAVSDKIQSWNPYNYKPGQTAKGNKTLGPAKGQKELPSNDTFATPQGEDVTDGIAEADRLGARTRIGKCTILFNGNSFWERAIRTHEQHDKLHGYRLHVLRQKLLDDVWDKPAYILSLLLRELSKPESERLEWLFWVDADTVILNPEIPIETFLPPPVEFDDVHLMYSNDWNGLNNGVFPIRVNQWAVDLFSAIVSYRYYRPDDPLVFRDQSAMNTLMNEPRFAKNIVQAPQRWFNAYQGEHNETLQPFQIRRGDLLVHFAGVPGREERMGYWLDRAEQHLDDWEVPVKSTSYPQEARDFWAEERDKRKNRKDSLAETRAKATQLLAKTAQDMGEYGDRLPPADASAIKEQQDALTGVMNDEKWAEDLEKVVQGIGALTQASAPLTAVIGVANKLLLNAAHEAIFAGEKDLLEGGQSAGMQSFELDQISQQIKNLKNLVMAPEENWNRHDITAATNAVTEARARYAGKTAAQQKAQQDEADRQKAIADAKKMVQIEAGLPPPSEETMMPTPGGIDGISGAAQIQATEAVVGQAAPTAPAGPPGTDGQPGVNGGPVPADSPLKLPEVPSAAFDVPAVAEGGGSLPMITVTPEPVLVWQTATMAESSWVEPSKLPDRR